MPLNNGDSTSAGVYTGERDNSITTQGIPTSIAGAVGALTRGPVMVPTYTVQTGELDSIWGKADPKKSFLHHCMYPVLQQTAAYIVRVAPNARYGGARLTTVNNFATVGTVGGVLQPTDFVFNTDDIMIVYGANPGAWNNDLRIVAYPDTGDSSGEGFVLQVYEGNSTIAVATYRGTLWEKKDGFGRQLFIEEVTKNSKFIRVMVNTAHPALQNINRNLVNAVVTTTFTGGTDGDEVTVGQLMEGWDLLSDPEELDVNILVECGSNSTAIQQTMLAIAEARDDCFAVLDVPSDVQEPQLAVNFRRNDLNVNTSYGALYAPDILIRDPYSDGQMYVPPSGDIAASFAKSDNGFGIQYAAAGIVRGQIPRALGLSHVYKLPHRDLFSQNQINPIRSISGGGICTWGVDTLQTFRSALSDIPIRRMISHLKVSIARTALTGVFEPNDTTLQLELQREADSYLRPFLTRGLQRYEIVCDERNNTPEYVASGDVMLDVYLWPTYVTRQIHLNAIVPKTGQIQFALNLSYGGN